ncbi:MAG: hypothetical protein HYX41_00030 [Bdellovibrio sp.]|nr:hypothetical protein [Bdellovibrio sp.]
MQRIKKGLAPNGMVVIRNYLRIPEGTDYSGFQRVTPSYQDLIDQEKVQLYSIEIFKKSKNELH